MLQSLPFRFEFNAEVFAKAGAGDRDRRIGGIVSTDGIDRQGEVLVQEGLDFEPFLKGGWFNDNHDSQTGALVGYPEMVELRTSPSGRRGWYVEGYLLKGHTRSDEIWNLANALQKSGRSLGFSVEGGIVERDPTDPKRVLKAVVREVAITRCPVNTETSLTVLAKSLAAGYGPASNVGVAGDGSPLRVQSLEAELNPRVGPKKKKKKIKKSEAIALLMQNNIPREAAERIVARAMNLPER